MHATEHSTRSSDSSTASHAINAAEHTALGLAEELIGFEKGLRRHARWVAGITQTLLLGLVGLLMWGGCWYVNWYIDADTAAFTYYLGIGLLELSIPLGLGPTLLSELRILSNRGKADSFAGRLYRGYLYFCVVKFSYRFSGCASREKPERMTQVAEEREKRPTTNAFSVHVKVESVARRIVRLTMKVRGRGWYHDVC
jgi:hypothetical protein